MKTSTAKKVLGTVVAAVTLTMITSIAPASAAQSTGKGDGSYSMQRDTGWDAP